MPRPTGRSALREPGPRSPRLASYRIDARLDAAKKQVVATELLKWRHDGTQPVSSVPLHLYMNAFKNEDSLFLRESRGQHRRARMTPGKWGWIDVGSIRRRGDDTELAGAARRGEDETVLEVMLPSPVSPGETLELELAFTTQLPEVFARTGYRGDFIMVGQWFPKIGVLDSTGKVQRWRCEPFHYLSEFFADFGTYDVILTVPDTHVVAATGVLVGAEPAGPGLRRLTYHAEDVHDFAWMADPRMRVVTTLADGDVEILLYHRPEQAGFAARHLEAARRTVETFGRLLGRYPWSVLTVIDPPSNAAEGAGGMEYPTLVTTAGDLALADLGALLPEIVTVHEVGHNWFHGILASNEVQEAWLDEGLDEYAASIVLDAWKGAQHSAFSARGLHLGYHEMERLWGDVATLATPTATRSWDFPTEEEYARATYAKTASALKMLEQRYGADRFHAALGAYARRWAFGHPTGPDFFQSLTDELGTDVAPFLEAVFHGRGEVDFRVREIRSRKVLPTRGVFGQGAERRVVASRDAPPPEEWISEVLVVNLGDLLVGADVELSFSDGSRVVERFAAGAGSRRFTFRRGAQVVAASVDPRGKILLESERLGNSQRTRPHLLPTLRAAARAGFWEQLLLGLVGL